MTQDDKPQAISADEEERRKRAAELHEEIERLKSGPPPDQHDAPRKPNPREFTEQSVRDEIGREQSGDEDS